MSVTLGHSAAAIAWTPPATRSNGSGTLTRMSDRFGAWLATHRSVRLAPVERSVAPPVAPSECVVIGDPLLRPAGP